MFARLFVLAMVLAVAVAFAPSRMAVRPQAAAVKMSVFDKAVEDWSKSYPVPFSVGWGPTTKAERWNGRHAMFGWVALIATGYAKSHGLIPSADALLDTKDWGTLAYIYGGSITNERAVIIVGHLHLLLFSVCAAVAPLSYQDKLYLEKGESDEPAAGLIPKIAPGLTKEAELLNGRLAMLGLVVLLITSSVNQTPILDTINTGLGGLLL
jgi:Chlorophyll A-B binding protein